MKSLSSSSILAMIYAASLAQAASVLYEMPNAHATVYYDLTNQLCGNNNPFPTNWGETSGINGGIPKCEQWAGASAKSLKGIGSNRVVAMHSGMVNADPDKWCGKEVVIYDAAGQKLNFAEGPLYVWDGCDACAGGSLIDLSAKAFVQLKGGDCGGNNPQGLRVQVLDNNIVQPIRKDGSGDSPPAPAPVSPAPVTPPPPHPPPAKSTTQVRPPTRPTGRTSTGNGNGNGNANSNPNPPVEGVFAPVGPATGPEDVTAPGAVAGESCVYGKWSCSGMSLRICNYLKVDQLGWQTIDTCRSKCEVTTAGSVDCR